jgi:hypothetical protein
VFVVVVPVTARSPAIVASSPTLRSPVIEMSAAPMDDAGTGKIDHFDPSHCSVSPTPIEHSTSAKELAPSLSLTVQEIAAECRLEIVTERTRLVSEPLGFSTIWTTVVPLSVPLAVRDPIRDDPLYTSTDDAKSGCVAGDDASTATIDW